MTPTLPNGEAPKGQHTLTPPAASTDPAGLTDSLRRFRTQSPQESLGLPTGNGLMWPFVQASVLAAVLLAGLTVGPYLMDRPTASATTTEPPARTDVKDSPPPPAAPTPAAATTATTGPDAAAKVPAAGTGPAAPTKPAAGAKKDITDVLGENGTKPASPKVNPLDKKEDDLLKDLK